MTSFRSSLRPWQRYLVATAIVSAATTIRLVAMQSYGMRAPYLTFYPAVMLAALYGGFPAGLLATILSALMAAYWWIEPVGQFLVKDPLDWLGMAVFLTSCTMISCITEAMHRAQNRARQAELQAGLAAERERADEAIRESEYHFRSIFNNSPIAIGIGRRDDGRLVEVNDAWLQLYGFERDEVIGRTATELNLYVRDNEREELIGIINERGHIINRVINQRRKTGETIVVLLSAEIIRLGEESFLQVMMTDITQQKLAEEALQEKNAEIERFTYMISHDLKSPLITVKTFLGYLEHDLEKGDAERIGNDLHYMRTAAERMERMLDELLELSRVGRMVNAPQTCTLRELAESALDMVAGRIAERGVEVMLENVDVALYGDRPRLLEIWQNLLENACKFMGDQAHPAIEIGAETRGHETVFFVSDNGAGIEPSYQEKIFGIFEKLDRNVEGSGLGLALVRRIVELNGGRIWAESQGRARGTCFRFTLPGAVKVDQTEDGGLKAEG